MNRDFTIDSQVKLIQITQIDSKLVTEIKGVLSDENVHRYLPFKSSPNETEVITFLNRIMGAKAILWGIVFNNDFIGIIDLINIDKGSTYLAYFIAQKYQGRGIISSAISHVTKFAFNMLNLTEIKASIVSRNIASRRVLEKRLILMVSMT